MKKDSINYLVIGDINIDIMMQADEYPPEGGEIVTANTSFRLGGSGCNTAVCLSKLGVQTHLVGCIGSDPLGEVAAEKMDQANIEKDLLSRSEDYQTGFFLILTSKSGNRTMFGNRGSNRIPPDPDRIIPRLSEFDGIHLSGYTLIDQQQAEAILKIITAALPYKPVISLDPGYFTFHHAKERLINFLPFLDYFLPSEDELKQWDKNQPEQAILQELFGYGVKNIIVKRGSKGSEWITKDGCFSAEAFRDPQYPIYDTTGAGDCLNAGFLFSSFHQLPQTTCLRFGNLLAYKAITSPLGIESIRTSKSIKNELKSFMITLQDVAGLEIFSALFNES